MIIWNHELRAIPSISCTLFTSRALGTTIGLDMIFYNVDVLIQFLGLALDMGIRVSTGYSSYIFDHLTNVAMHSHFSDLDNTVSCDNIPRVVFFTSFLAVSRVIHILLQLLAIHRNRRRGIVFHNLAGYICLWRLYVTCGMLFCVLWLFWCSTIHSDVTHSCILIGDAGWSRATWLEHWSRGFQCKPGLREQVCY